jgi:2-polyprenyl-3-methyl-5-hydroxy-6-metoxy-1,4-benzoquinol methylase
MESYFDNVRGDLLALIAGSDLKVLEVGCGTGVTGAVLLKDARASVVDGVERDTVAASQARTRLSNVWEADVETLDWDDLRHDYDVVMFGDTLEHLVDPWMTVRKAASCLKPGGKLIASIPNARCLMFCGPLVIRGRLDYADMGILDRTHLRWFTRHSAVDLIRQGGFAITSVVPRVIGDHRRNAFYWAMRAIGPFGVLQYIVIGQRPV